MMMSETQFLIGLCFLCYLLFKILFDFFCLDRGWSSQRGLPVDQDLRTRFEQRSFFAIEL